MGAAKKALAPGELGSVPNIGSMSVFSNRAPHGLTVTIEALYKHILFSKTHERKFSSFDLVDVNLWTKAISGHG
jgi:hypothetical protein